MKHISLQTAQRLQELGWKRETLLSWGKPFSRIKDTEYELILESTCADTHVSRIPAPFAEELEEALIQDFDAPRVDISIHYSRITSVDGERLLYIDGTCAEYDMRMQGTSVYLTTGDGIVEVLAGLWIKRAEQRLL